MFVSGAYDGRKAGVSMLYASTNFVCARQAGTRGFAFSPALLMSW